MGTSLDNGSEGNEFQGFADMHKSCQLFGDQRVRSAVWEISASWSDETSWANSGAHVDDLMWIKNEEDGEDTQIVNCPGCHRAAPGVTFQPCGHTGCNLCSLKVLGESCQCPTCKQRVLGLDRVADRVTYGEHKYKSGWTTKMTERDRFSCK